MDHITNTSFQKETPELGLEISKPQSKHSLINLLVNSIQSSNSSGMTWVSMSELLSQNPLAKLGSVKHKQEEMIGKRLLKD